MIYKYSNENDRKQFYSYLHISNDISKAMKYHNDYNKENYLITYKILHLMQIYMIYIINNIMNIILKIHL